MFGERINLDLSGFSDGRVRYIKYVVDSLLPKDPVSYVLDSDRDQITIDCSHIDQGLCDSIKNCLDPQGQLIYTAFVQNWRNNYLQTRHHRRNHQIIVNRLDDFKNLTDFKSWPSQTLMSRIKKQNRRIYRGEFEGRKISVAETLDQHGAVRETELAIERFNEAGNYEFYVYSAQGGLILHSDFPNGQRLAPISCAACHMNSQGQTTRFFP